MISALPIVATAVVSFAGGASVGTYTSDVSRRICALATLQFSDRVEYKSITDSTVIKFNYGSHGMKYEISRILSNVALSGLVTKIFYVALSLISPLAAGYFALGLIAATTINQISSLAMHFDYRSTAWGIILNESEMDALKIQRINPKQIRDPGVEVGFLHLLKGDTFFSRIFKSDSNPYKRYDD